MLIKANFGALDALADQIRATVGRVDGEMARWSTAASAAEAEWLDRAGGEFAAVRARWQELSTAQQAMLSALQSATTEARVLYEATVRSSAARVASVSL